MAKYIFISGGVLSGLGKGTATASIGRLLKNNGDKKIIVVKCDGYLNVDPGTMNPIEHGEVFVLNDGTEVDMDFGHYERFIGVEGEGDWNITSGKLFSRLIDKEREGKFLGKTIQIIPHAVDEVIEWWVDIENKHNPDYMLIEIGGTVGDNENFWFLEAARRLPKRIGRKNVAYVHLTYLPMLYNTGELKTKPAQRDIALLRSLGIHPDVLIARSHYNLPKRIRKKLSSMVDMKEDRIISGVDVKNIYEIPVMFYEQGMVNILSEILNDEINVNLEKWNNILENIKHPDNDITIAICGKYTDLHDSYASVIEALNNAGAHLKTNVNIKWIETTDIENNTISVEESLKNVDGIIVPGGFGSRGVEGKIKVIRYARENKIPFLGLCYGLQLAVIEYARNICNLKDANSTEINPNTPYPLIDILPEQKNVVNKGGTMRLGAYPANLVMGTLVHSLYNKDVVYERHRHRYEVNPEYHEILQKNGLMFSGMSPDKRLVEFIELPRNVHPYFVATQAHPELKSRFERPAPLFYGLVRACIKNETTSNKPTEIIRPNNKSIIVSSQTQ
ncbi:CTP synthase [Candidatus Micrarchaeota archaeon]|nr:CTP synthase [Candidatus Micrarchaeota archaeon]